VTINSNDPAYLGGYLSDYLIGVHKALDLGPEQLAQLAANSFKACFLDNKTGQRRLRELDGYIASC
jgi:adenosine deaminase